MIYLDYNATAPVHAATIDAVVEALKTGGNPSSVHRAGRSARACLEAARARIAKATGARPRDVVFTSGGTEANALALTGAAGPLLVSAIEHPSVLAAAPDAVQLTVGADGVIDLAALEQQLAAVGGKPLVSVMAANNETGVIQPLREAARLVHRAGGTVHCDATQLLGKGEATLEALGADLITVSAHKIGGPAGIGALIMRSGIDIQPLLLGGGQEMGRRAGTEPLALAAGFAAALDAMAALEGWTCRAALMRDRLEAALLAAAPDALIYGGEAARLPTTTCVGLPGLAAETQVMALDLAGIAVSAGSACSSGKVKTSAVLAAMGVSAKAAGEALRISLGWGTTEADIDACSAAWTQLANRRQAA